MKRESSMKVKRFVVFMLCVALVVTTVMPGTTLNVKASAVSVGETVLPAEDNSVSDGNVEFYDSNGDVSVQDLEGDINFYDSDGKTLLLTVPMEFGESGATLNTAHSNYGDINLTRRGYAIESWYCTADGETYSPEELYNSLVITGELDFVACWSNTPQTFTIEYHMYDGEFETDAPTAFTVESEDITLPQLVKTGYVFGGWYQEESCENPINVIPAGTYIDSDAEGNIASYHVYAKWTQARVGKVTRPEVSNDVAQTLTVTFDALEGVTGYEILGATDSEFAEVVISRDLGNETTFALSDVEYGVKYYFKVRAYVRDSAGQMLYGDYSNVGTCTVKNGVVNQMGRLTIANVGKGKLEITYDRVEKVSGYEALYSTDKNFAKNNTVREFTSTKTFFNITGAYYGETYYVKMRAYGLDEDGNKVYGNYSPVASCTVKNGTVKQASKPTARNNSKSKINVTLKEIVGVSGYELAYSTDPDFAKKNTTIKDLKKKTTFTMSGLYYGETYYYKVRAYGVDQDGERIVGKYSDVVSCTVKNGKVKQVAKPTAKNDKKQKISVSFTALENVSGYELIYSTNKNFKKDAVTKDLKKKTTFTLQKAVHGKTYYFKVRAYGLNASGKKIYGNFSLVRSCKVDNGYIEPVGKPKAKNNAVGQITVNFTKLSTKVSGYELVYSSDKNFKKNVFTKNLGKKNTGALTNLPKNKTYYIKVRAYAINSKKEKIYGGFSPVISCKVKKGVKEHSLSGNMGTLTKVGIKNKTDLYVTADVSKRIKSSDEYYYLVKVDPDNGTVLKQIATSEKNTKVVFQLPVRDAKGNNHIQGKYGVAIKSGSKYVLITTNTGYIDNPEDAATYTKAFPTPASKKGRQGLYNTAMGDKHTFANFNLNDIIGSKSSHNVAYKYNGKTYYFYYPRLGDVATANADGGVVTVQVMLQWASQSTDLILPSGRTSGARYYAFNTKEQAAREKIEAAFHFLTEYASQENYHVDNWILGNEVNTYMNMNAKWYYAGYISRDAFMENYASTFRMLYYAAKSNNKNARVYICTDHTWIDRDNDWGAKYFMGSFNQKITGQNPNIKWNLAYHAYSAVLTNADFWNDGTLAPHTDNADFVSPNNLEILTNFVKSNFGTGVRIILSEQGFSSSGGVGSPYNEGRQSGENVQAAAVAWLYYKAQFSDMIDAVIYSSGDHGGAGYQFGVEGKVAENVYKYMDTPKYATYTNQCLSVIGKSSWQDAVSGFDGNVLNQMPSR